MRGLDVRDFDIAVTNIHVSPCVRVQLNSSCILKIPCYSSRRSKISGKCRFHQALTEMLSIHGTAMQRTPCDSNRHALGCPSIAGRRSHVVAKEYRDLQIELDR
jgi:hypothetical protein